LASQPSTISVSTGLYGYAAASSGVGIRPGLPVRSRTMDSAPVSACRWASCSSSAASAETPISA
jgi:hypothetical protein